MDGIDGNHVIYSFIINIIIIIVIITVVIIYIYIYIFSLQENIFILKRQIRQPVIMQS